MLSDRYSLPMAVTSGLASVGLMYVCSKWWKSDVVKGETSGLKIADLRDPDIRSNHLEFNKMLLSKFPEADAIRLDDTLGGMPVFLIHRYDRVNEVLQNHEVFTSNPWLGSRSIVALNTMEKSDHDRVLRLIKRFYSAPGVSVWKDLIKNLVDRHGQNLKKDGDVFAFSKRFHMHLSLQTSGLCDALNVDDPEIDQFVRWNDSAVLLAAPLGGVGARPVYSFTQICTMVKAAIGCIPQVSKLIRRIGLLETWKLLSPIETFFPSAPYTQCWDYPGMLIEIPSYFCRVYDLMSKSRENSPSGVLFSSIGSSITASEALATVVQLMVNMTTANAIMSIFFRMSENVDVKPEQVLADDAPLQRNLRRAREETTVGSVRIPKGSIILLMLGAANKSCPVSRSLSTFGHGLHHCLGRHLVGLELDVVHEWLKSQWAGNKCTILEASRLVDRDVGNWGFSKFRISPF